MTPGRLVIALAVLGAAGVLLWHVIDGSAIAFRPGAEVSATPRPRRDTPITMTRSEQCRPCHEEVFEEWERSHHAFAYVNPEVQLISKGFQGPTGRDCLPCHAPRPVLETGLGVRVLERGENLEDGVDCFTCHFDPANNVMLGAGPLGPGADQAPCQPAVHPDISSLELCAPCHNQHKVHEEWRQTRFGVAGAAEFQDCNDCHMPVVDRKPGPDGRPRKGRSHVFPGAHDPDFLKTAATYSALQVEPHAVLVEIKNTGAGHNFPTDERHRAVDLELIVDARDGRRFQARIDRYRNPYRGEENEFPNPLPEPGAERTYPVSLGPLGEAQVEAVRKPAEFNPERHIAYPHSTQIAHGEARSYLIRLPAEVARATVRFYYRIFPFQKDQEAVLLHEQSIPLE